MDVLIVAKTYMKNAFCVGAYDITNQKNIRLLTSSCDNQPFDTKFEIGQIWDIKYSIRSNIVMPHSEDVMVESAIFLKIQNNLKEYLLKNIPVWEGSPECIFNGKITFPIGHSGYVNQNVTDLHQSVGFWLPDQNLELTIFEDNKHYFYFGNQVIAFPYVGSKKVVDQIKKGTLIRVSLARWWTPDIKRQPKRCYCQMSGWYDN